MINLFSLETGAPRVQWTQLGFKKSHSEKVRLIFLRISETSLQKIFSDCETYLSVSARNSSFGLVEFNNKVEALEALVLTNNCEVPDPGEQC